MEARILETGGTRCSDERLKGYFSLKRKSTLGRRTSCDFILFPRGLCVTFSDICKKILTNSYRRGISVSADISVRPYVFPQVSPEDTTLAVVLFRASRSFRFCANIQCISNSEHFIYVFNILYIYFSIEHDPHNVRQHCHTHFGQNNCTFRLF